MLFIQKVPLLYGISILEIQYFAEIRNSLLHDIWKLQKGAR